ncbi:hypothetical protein K437DRAFT_216781, partial [Tilletiaria anomala UBC 951]
WLAYIPTDQVKNLQSAVSNTSSALYKGQKGTASTQLASYIDPTFNILNTAGVSKSGAQLNTVASGNDHNKTVRDALIGVCSAVGAILIAAILFLIWRKQRKSKETA